ncbi:MAG: hypothetical protein BGP03_33350 [Pseudonocardia sp. 73-21]|nr:MAG: hypothetical protein BGP03_33350 [Pseudonocardia sp. 73-21]
MAAVRAAEAHRALRAGDAASRALAVRWLASQIELVPDHFGGRLTVVEGKDVRSAAEHVRGSRGAERPVQLGEAERALVYSLFW